MPSSAGTSAPRRRPLRTEVTVIYTVIGALLVGVFLVKAVTVQEFSDQPFWALYSIVVTGYILSRFLLARFYRPRPPAPAAEELPSVTIVVPAMNEEEVIRTTLLHCLQVDYPADRLQVVAIDDCSTDRTHAVMVEVQAEFPQLEVIRFPVNRGKRHGMAAGLERARGEFVVFIDSDSLIEPEGLRRLVPYFADPAVGAVAGHTDVQNATTNLLTKMQAVRYFVAFRVYKSAEALFDSVTCCSGCFSGYRRSAVEPVVERWLGQTFLGSVSSYGDDRSLTNFLLPNWKVLYAPDAQAYTVVPDDLRTFLRQQLRWKKSWIRESLRAATFMWRKHPIMAVSFYLSVLLPLLAPQVVLRALVVQPIYLRAWPYWYIGGVLAMALLYGLYYRLHRREGLWVYGVFFALFYTGVLVWQLPWAIATLRDSRWGTREARGGASPPTAPVPERLPALADGARA